MNDDTQRAQTPTRTSVTLAYANNVATVTMVSKEVGTNQYRAIGFSDDQDMVTLACLHRSSLRVHLLIQGQRVHLSLRDSRYG